MGRSVPWGALILHVVAMKDNWLLRALLFASVTVQWESRRT